MSSSQSGRSSSSRSQSSRSSSNKSIRRNYSKSSDTKLSDLDFDYNIISDSLVMPDKEIKIETDFKKRDNITLEQTVQCTHLNIKKSAKRSRDDARNSENDDNCLLIKILDDFEKNSKLSKHF